MPIWSILLPAVLKRFFFVEECLVIAFSLLTFLFGKFNSFRSKNSVEIQVMLK